MVAGILGEKVGMTRIFAQNGESIPVTVILAGPCQVIQKKTIEKDGYNAVQLGFKEIKEKKVSKPITGHINKYKVNIIKLPGHMRTDRVTVKKVEVIKINLERNLILVRGSVPGAKGAVLVINKNG